MNYDVFMNLDDVRESKIPEPKVNLGVKIDGVIHHFMWDEFRVMINAQHDGDGEK